MIQVWGAIAIFLICPILGGLPVISWITYALTKQHLSRQGTGNISVSAAFYHGGKFVGILAVLAEALKGIAAVLLARAFFPTDPTWELIALIALVIGRYWIAKGAGTTNVAWGYLVHDWQVAGLVFLLGGISFTILRERQLGRIAILILFPLITALLHSQDSDRIIAAIALAGLIGWIYQKIPDDLDLKADQATSDHSEKVFRFFQGNKAILSLDDNLAASKVGNKAATLAQLKRWGYPVPMGWVLPPGDDPAPLISTLRPSEAAPLVVRSSAIGEDSEQASAAGQYESILNVTSIESLQRAIARCQAAYDRPTAIQYRRDRGLAEAAMAVLIQKQVLGIFSFSGVAFSRDPLTQQGDAVVIEALPGDAMQVVSGKVTPQQYRVYLPQALLDTSDSFSWTLPEGLQLQIDGQGDVPATVIQQVAYLARHLESKYHGIPQDIEWSYDGQTLWLLQSRPITTLLPIWTRKIAAEVIPGLIRPLTWSINQPLTCGVWGEIFTLVLGKRSLGLDFQATATLHYSRAYFNASLVGQIFRLMGLPAESLEFLTRGAKLSKPSLRSIWQNLPGLLRLIRRELSLEKDFKRDYKQYFGPALTKLANQPAKRLDSSDLLQRIDLILKLLKQVTYYSILAPLSASLRQAVFRVKDSALDHSQSPEVASLRSLAALSVQTRQVLLLSQLDHASVFELLAQSPDGRKIIQQFNQLINRYGYLSEVGTDIAIPTWQENPQPIQELFEQFVTTANAIEEITPPKRKAKPKKGFVQRRVDLKGRVTEVYSKLLAQLRWSFVALEQVCLDLGLLEQSGDIFFLRFDEIQRLVGVYDSELTDQLGQLVQQRRSQLLQDSQLDPVPLLAYGNPPPISSLVSTAYTPSSGLLQGIGASLGQVEGCVKVLRNLQFLSDINRETILVVPYTDSGWAPLLARAGGLIAEVGGRLSHGAIVAREYGIPAVMDIHNATGLLKDGQRVRMDGQLGIVEILS